MPEIGQNLSHYSLAEKIGKGGMGEVFRAKDQKLGRDVAIKVLPEEFAKDADRVARFQREAKLLASLNHPNIAAIYGLEESTGTHFLVLELIEGDTLADRLKHGAIPAEESLKLALQITEALEAAHEKGVIHRDLKPANIKVTTDGKVKVLDFGLAKAFSGDQEQVNLSNSPTLSDMATQQGVILGTAAYMSPEQARGKPVDKRTDIWAFGCVLYEMLTGKAAFQGEDVTEILAAVVKSGVNLELLPENLHPDIRKLITRCLQKDQKRRYSGIGDVQYEIEQVLADPGGVFVQPMATAKPRKKLRVGIPWVAAAVVLSIIIGGLAVWYFRPAEPPHVMRFDYELPMDGQFSALDYPALAISPDGKQFVYSTAEGLFLRSVDEFTTKLIAGTQASTSQPFFSPDGKWVGYFSVSDLSLKKININGGASVTLCNITPYGMHWGTDGTIICGQPGNLMKVSSNGGNPEPLLKSKSGVCFYPQMLPDGKTVLYTAPVPQPRIMVQSIETGEPKELFAGIAARYVSTGHIVSELGRWNQ
jgi:serine/threonine protein kinase